MSDSAAPGSGFVISLRWQCLAVAASFALSVALCAAIYLVFAAPGPWLQAPPDLRWSAQEMTAARGKAQLRPEGLVIAAPDASGTAVVSLTTTFRARDYPVIAWDVSALPEDVEATVLWYSDIDSSRVFRRALVNEAGRLAPARLAQDPGWLGRIGGLALVLRGSFTEPVVVQSAAAKPMSAAEVAGERLQEWLRFEPWTGASINGRVAHAQSEDVPLVAGLAIFAALAALFYTGLWWLKSRAFGPAMLGGLAAVFVAAWLIADAAWEWNLARQASLTRDLYGGKTWDERHRAAEDGALFAFMDRVRNKLPSAPTRVFIAAELPYFRARGAYHLYPYDVYYDPSSATIPPPGVIRKDDYLLVYQRRGVQYDASERRLRWDGNAPVDADLVIADTGAALFHIR